jgi:hypothetical protein
MNHGVDDTWYRRECFANIYPSMNRNEWSLLHRSIEGGRSFASPLAIPVRQKGEYPLPKSSSDAYGEKEYAHILTVVLHFQVCTLRLNRGSPPAEEGCFRLTCVLFNPGGSLIDDGVYFGPPG